MHNERYVKLFSHGRSQAIRIPREFELPGESVIMRKDGFRLIIEPVSMHSLLAGSQPMAEDFGPISIRFQNLSIFDYVSALKQEKKGSPSTSSG